MFKFNKPKIGIFSDIHIGVHRDSKFWHDISSQWMDWFVQKMHDENIEDIVFCGDYFHTRDEVSVDTLHFGANLLKRLKDFNVLMIVGNHDCFLKESSEVNSLTPFGHWPNVTIVDKPLYIQAFKKNIGFIPWGIKSNEINSSDVLFGHFEINNFKMNSFALCKDGFDTEDLTGNNKLIISGHFHLRDTREIGDSKIVYVGNPFQMDFSDENASKGVYTLDLKTLDMVFHENTHSPQHFNLQLSDLMSYGGITQEVKSYFNNNLVKLKVDRRVSPDDLEYILSVYKSLNPSNIVIEQMRDICKFGLDENKEDLSSFSIEEAIVRYIDSMDGVENSNEIKKYCVNLYQTYSK